jgi:hypothetical protein
VPLAANMGCVDLGTASSRMTDRSGTVHIGVTGHRHLTPETVELVTHAFEECVARHAADRDLVGISCLAEGADQLFARVVLEHGGALDAVIPAEDYRAKMTEVVRREFDMYLRRARRVTKLPYAESKGPAYMAASLVLVERSDLVVAVWDGERSASFSGTGDVVDYARQVGIPVEVIWPAGARRR